MGRRSRSRRSEREQAAALRPWLRGPRLGVDVGSVRVGVAVSDPDGLLATALETVQRAGGPAGPRGTRGARGPGGHGGHAGPGAPGSPGSQGAADLGRPSADIARIAAHVLERGVVEVVVGLPRSLDGTEGTAARLARGYAVRLADVVVPVPVRLLDERLSTAGAQRALHDGGVRSRQQRSVVDQVAAAWILQTALDLERSSGRAPGEVVPTSGPAEDQGSRHDRTGEGGRTADDEAP